jgi:hypothetical protein
MENWRYPVLKHTCSKYDNLLIYSEIPMLLSTHHQVLSHHMPVKILYPYPMKTSGLNMCIGTGNIPHRGTESSSTRDYSGSSSISVSKILDCTQQPFMVVAEELFRSVLHMTAPWTNFSIQSGEGVRTLDIRSALNTSDNLNHKPS